MTIEIVVTSLLIFFARVADVSIGTIRTMAVMNGRKGAAWALAFVEILVWVVAVARVITNLSNPAYAISYALGFATGTFVGMAIEEKLAFGERAVRVFSREGERIASRLRELGFGVTEFEGRGMAGPVEMLFIEVPRKRVEEVVREARAIDGRCYYVIDDIRAVAPRQGPHAGEPSAAASSRK